MRFPKMHIATSVVNRILNAYDDIEPAPSEPQMPPIVPDAMEEGAQLDQQLAQSPAEMPALEDDPNSETANALEPVLHGGTMLDGLVDTVSGM